jgi:hypothetical protein
MGAISIAPTISVVSWHFSENFWHLKMHFPFFSMSILQIKEFYIQNQKKKIHYFKNVFFFCQMFGTGYLRRHEIFANFKVDSMMGE